MSVLNMKFGPYQKSKRLTTHGELGSNNLRRLRSERAERAAGPDLELNGSGLDPC